MKYADSDLLKLYSDASFYDEEFKGRDFEIPFYSNILQETKSVLEVACGTGRLTIPLHQSGISIEGRDISPHMIAQAEKNAKAAGVEMQFRVESAMATQGKFDAIFMATNAFQHLLDFNVAVKCLRACKNALFDKGMLIIDMQVPNIQKLVRTTESKREYKTFNWQGRQITAFITGKYSNLKQVYQFEIRYYDGNECIKTKFVAMRMYYPQEMQLLIEYAGLKIEDIFGGYDRMPMEDDSGKQIYILKK